MNVIEVKSEKVIHKPASAIWRVIEPVAGLSKWLPLGERWELLSGQGAGRRQRMHAKWGNRSVAIDQEVIEYIPNEILRWSHVKELVDGKPAPAFSKEVVTSVRLEAAGPDTRVILLSQNTPGNIFKAFVITMIAKPRIRSAFKQALENIERMTV